MTGCVKNTKLENNFGRCFMVMEWGSNER